MKKVFQKLRLSIFLLVIPSAVLLAQNRSVSGRISDSTGAPLQDITVLLKGTSIGATTNLNGVYKINIPVAQSNPVLIISGKGFNGREVAVNGRSVVDISLRIGVSDLSDVVVIGYGQATKRQLTSAISKIEAKSIEALPVYSVEQALQGAAPGITVIQNSGSPGSALTIRVRGTGTAGTAQPLFIVDGLQVPDLNYLNAADIESISILKDAAASAIYGARGGNGVVIVQTKTGKRNMRQPSISLDAYTALQDLGHTPPLMDRDQYVQYYNDYAKKNGGTPFTDAQRQALPNTNWYHEIFNNNVPMNNASLSLANGGDHYSYYISGGIFDQKGLAGGNTGKSTFTRKNLTFNFEADLFPNFTLKVGGSLVSETRNYLFENSSLTGTALMNYINALPPIYPVFDSANKSIPYDMGDLSRPLVVNGVTVPAVGAVTNPFLSLLLTNNRSTDDIKVFNIAGTWKPFRQLEISSSYAYYQDLLFGKSFTPSFDYRPNQNFYNPNAYLTETNSASSYSQWEGNAKYSFSELHDQHLELLAGFSVLNSNTRSSGQTGSNFFVNDFSSINFALIKDPTTIITFIPQAQSIGLLSYYGRINYAYKQKYLLAATLRSDASSLFGPDHRTGIFPSVSAGWIISEESFLKNSNAVNLLKLRGSWGINGNNFINPYQYSSIVNPNSGPSFAGQNTSGISIPYLANTNVKWEQATQTDFGIDINMLGNTLGLTVDYYNKKNSGVLVPVGTPEYTGYNSAAANIADVKNSGIEILLAYHKTYTGGFSWNAAFNLGYNKNEVTSLGLNGQPIPGGVISLPFPDPITNTYVGKPIAGFYGFKVDHLDSAGNFVFKDLDKNGVIDGRDKTFIGSAFPDFTYGATLGAGFMGFDVSAFLYGSQGNKIFDATTRLDASYASRPVSYLQPGAPGNVLGKGAAGTTQTDISDFYVKDGSFAKLKTITIGYSLSPSVLRHIGLSKLRVYISGQNLFVITKYTGVDPEIGQSGPQNTLDVGIDRGFYPQPKIIQFGIQAKF